MEVVKTTGFTGQNPTQATLCPVALLPLSTTLAPDFAQGVQSPRESQSFFVLSSRRLFPPAQEILPVSWFQRSPSFSEAQLLVWCVAHKPSALGQPRACFSPLAPRLRGLCLTLWSHHLRGFYDSGGGLFFLKGGGASWLQVWLGSLQRQPPQPPHFLFPRHHRTLTFHTGHMDLS